MGIHVATSSRACARIMTSWYHLCSKNDITLLVYAVLLSENGLVARAPPGGEIEQAGDARAQHIGGAGERDAHVAGGTAAERHSWRERDTPFGDQRLGERQRIERLLCAISCRPRHRNEQVERARRGIFE